jgi:hypothetical protein
MFKNTTYTAGALVASGQSLRVRHAVICGSYFAYFDRAWPDLKLAEHHPISAAVSIRPRWRCLLPMRISMGYAELPYIFGTQPAENRSGSFWPSKSAACRRQHFTRAAAPRWSLSARSASALPAHWKQSRRQQLSVGYYNLEWTEMLRIVHKHMGVPDKKTSRFRTGCLS